MTTKTDAGTEKDTEYGRYIEIWIKVVETQMHFNEMSVKSRQLGLTFVAAALGVAVVLIGQDTDFFMTISLWGWPLKIHVSVILILGAWPALAAVRQLDLNVYHKMLRGAVTFGEDFEENYMKKIFSLEKGMTQVVSHYSRYSDANKKKNLSGKYEYVGEVQITAEDKIKNFYSRTTIFLWVAAIALLIVTNLSRPPEDGDTKGKKESSHAIELIIKYPEIPSRVEAIGVSPLPANSQNTKEEKGSEN